MAAGFSLEENKLDLLRDTLNQRCTLTRKELTEKVTIDREVALAEIDGNLVRELNYLQPVGEKNEGALFMFPFQMPGGGELLVIIAIIVVLFGSSKAFSTAKDLGKEVYRLKKDVDDLKDEVKDNITIIK